MQHAVIVWLFRPIFLLAFKAWPTCSKCFHKYHLTVDTQLNICISETETLFFQGFREPLQWSWSNANILKRNTFKLKTGWDILISGVKLAWILQTFLTNIDLYLQENTTFFSYVWPQHVIMNWSKNRGLQFLRLQLHPRLILLWFSNLSSRHWKYKNLHKRQQHLKKSFARSLSVVAL